MSQNNQRENVTDILCIGAQKASTSWLHNVLNAHAKTYAFPDSRPVTSTCKEAHFWDWNHQRGIEWYRNLMTPPEPSRLTLDFTPEYATLTRDKIKECKDINPTAKVIYILRDPLARAISAIRMHTKWQTKDAAADDVVVDYDEAFLKLIDKSNIIGNSSYVANYKNWARFYDNILVLNYEDILDRPDQVIARVFDYVGLDINNMDDDSRKKLGNRLTRRVWASTQYGLTTGAIQFLNGLTYPKRQAAEEKFGFTFTEGREYL